jgi:hypothetical protein
MRSGSEASEVRAGPKLTLTELGRAVLDALRCLPSGQKASCVKVAPVQPRGGRCGR